MSKVSIELVDARGLHPYEAQLSVLEREITYPVDDGADRFWVDHGTDYTAFFRNMGESRFLFVREGERILGIGAGVRRSAVGFRHVPMPVLYAADLKFAPAARGKGYARSLGRRALLEIFREPAFWGWQLIFGAAMRDARGDVRRSFTGPAHPGRLGSSLATLHIFFTPVAQLRAIRGDGPAEPKRHGLDLGVRRDRPLTESTTGKKDLRLVSSGNPWPLHHLPRSPSQWGAGLGAMLREASTTLEDGDIVCFSLDERLKEALAFLNRQGILTDTRCTIIAMPGLPLGPMAWVADWVHLPTSEI